MTKQKFAQHVSLVGSARQGPLVGVIAACFIHLVCMHRGTDHSPQCGRTVSFCDLLTPMQFPPLDDVSVSFAQSCTSDFGWLREDLFPFGSFSCRLFSLPGARIIMSIGDWIGTHLWREGKNDHNKTPSKFTVRFWNKKAWETRTLILCLVSQRTAETRESEGWFCLANHARRLLNFWCKKCNSDVFVFVVLIMPCLTITFCTWQQVGWLVRSFALKASHLFRSLIQCHCAAFEAKQHARPGAAFQLADWAVLWPWCWKPLGFARWATVGWAPRSIHTCSARVEWAPSREPQSIIWGLNANQMLKTSEADFPSGWDCFCNKDDNSCCSLHFVFEQRFFQDWMKKKGFWDMLKEFLKTPTFEMQLFWEKVQLSPSMSLRGVLRQCPNWWIGSNSEMLFAVSHNVLHWQVCTVVTVLQHENTIRFCARHQRLMGSRWLVIDQLQCTILLHSVCDSWGLSSLLPVCSLVAQWSAIPIFWSTPNNVQLPSDQLCVCKWKSKCFCICKSETCQDTRREGQKQKQFWLCIGRLWSHGLFSFQRETQCNSFFVPPWFFFAFWNITQWERCTPNMCCQDKVPNSTSMPCVPELIVDVLHGKNKRPQLRISLGSHWRFWEGFLKNEKGTCSLVK